MTRGERIAAAARGAVGAPFRLHGRDPATGLDCIGLVLMALAAAGWKGGGGVPSGYALRGGTATRVEHGLRAAGLRRVRTARAGDVLVVKAGPAQWHMMVAVGSSGGAGRASGGRAGEQSGACVHAHAGLGCVVEMPGAPSWPVVGRWRWGR